MAALLKLNVSEIAAELDEPFSMMNVAIVGDIIVGVYICQGTMEWHRHLDIDELFWVYAGAVVLESEWGEVRLRPGELAVVPKGINHRSSAPSRASVLLLRCGFMPQRKNGRRRLYATSDEASLKRVGLHSAIQALVEPFQFQSIAQVEDSVVQVAWGEGVWPVESPASHDVLFFVLKGTGTVRTAESMHHLHPGDLVVVPQGTAYQLSTTQGTALVRLTREQVP